MHPYTHTILYPSPSSLSLSPSYSFTSHLPAFSIMRGDSHLTVTSVVRSGHSILLSISFLDFIVLFFFSVFTQHLISNNNGDFIG